MNDGFDPVAAADRALAIIDELSEFFNLCKAGERQPEKTKELALLVDDMSDFAVKNDLLVDFRAMTTAISIVSENTVNKQEKLTSILYKRLLRPQVEFFKHAV